MYKSQADLAEDFNLHVRTITSRIKEMRVMERYHGAVVDDGNIIRCYYPAFVDYMTNRRRLRDKNLKKTVPDYDPKRIIAELGLSEKTDMPCPVPNKETIKSILKEILMEGIA